MTVLIAGAGIGGLALGLSLQQLGIPFRIHEAVADLQPLGVGINIQPHAVRELHDLGLAEALEQTGLQTQEVAYFSAQGGRIWSEPRGRFAGYSWPQYSIHRGELQMLLRNALIDRAGPQVLISGSAVTGWITDADGVRLSLADRTTGAATGEDRGQVFVAADGINSTARARLYPDEGPAHWAGVMMWRGITEAPRFLTGRTMAMAGRKSQKFVCYPIRDLPGGRCLVNWIADRGFPADHDWARQDWNREGDKADLIPHFKSWRFDWLDIPALIEGASAVWEYPMVDRNPLPRWTDGRMTLLGDAAHAMYPIGSNGASQAIIDARILARELRDKGIGPAALHSYESHRRENVNALIEANRGDGPDRVLDIVADRAPNGFEDIADVMSRQELEQTAQGYKALAGMDIAALNARGPLVPPDAD